MNLYVSLKIKEIGESNIAFVSIYDEIEEQYSAVIMSVVNGMLSEVIYALPEFSFNKKEDAIRNIVKIYEERMKTIKIMSN